MCVLCVCVCVVCGAHIVGFRLKHFLRENEQLSTFLRSNASLSEYQVQQVLEAQVHLDQVLLAGLGTHLREMCPSKGGRRNFQQFVSLSDQQVALEVQEKLCQAPLTWLDQAEENFLLSLDFFRPIEVGGTIASGHFLSTKEANITLKQNTLT